jgi:hypothetical protein
MLQRAMSIPAGAPPSYDRDFINNLLGRNFGVRGWGTAAGQLLDALRGLLLPLLLLCMLPGLLLCQAHGPYSPPPCGVPCLR